MGQSERSRDMATKVLLCALLGSAASKPVAEADLRFTRSAEAEAKAKAEPDAEALRPFAYSSPSGAVSFSLGGAAPSVASAAPLVSSVGHHSVAHATIPFTAHQPVLASAIRHSAAPVVAPAAPFTTHQHVASVAPVLASSAPFTAHQPVSAVAHQSVSPAVVASPFVAHQQRLAPVAAHHAVVATAAPFTAHQPVSAGLTSNLVNVAATPVTHHAAHIARPIAHTASHVAHPVSLPALTHTAHVARPVVTHASHGPTHFTHPAIHASHIARPVVHGPIYRSGIALHGKPFTAFNKEDSEDKEEGGDEEERSSGLTYFKFANKEEEEEEKEEETEEEERSARVIEDTSEVFNDIDLEETSQNLIVDTEDLNEVSEQQLEVEGRTVEEVSSTTTSATTTTTMAPTDILQKVKEELGEEPKISVEEDVLVVKSEGEDETIIAVPVKKIQQLIDALEILKVFFV